MHRSMMRGNYSLPATLTIKHGSAQHTSSKKREVGMPASDSATSVEHGSYRQTARQPVGILTGPKIMFLGPATARNAVSFNSFSVTRALHAPSQWRISAPGEENAAQEGRRRGQVFDHEP